LAPAHKGKRDGREKRTGWIDNAITRVHASYGRWKIANETLTNHTADLDGHRFGFQHFTGDYLARGLT
jgi:hypothetical protein